MNETANLINENEFHSLADRWLAHVTDQLEEMETLDVEYHSGIVTITLPSGKALIINKHAPSRQLWLASPLSGGLHFSCNAEKKWALTDGRTLEATLSHDLESLAGIKIML